MRRGKVFKVKGHKGWRGQKQINKTRFVKDFIGTKAECEAQCGEWLDMLENTYRNHWDGTLSWGQFKIEWEKWAVLETKSKIPMAPRTIQEYKWAFKQAERLVKPLRYLTDINIQKLRFARGTLEKEARAKSADNYAPNKFVGCIKNSLVWAMEQGYMRDISLDNFRSLPVAEVKVKTQDIKEIELLLKYGTTKERVVVLLGFDCGCRPEEIANLLWDNLDLENGFADIAPREANPSRGISKWHPKAWKVRQIRLTPRLIDEIKKLPRSSSYVILNQYGEGYSQQGFSKFYRDFVKKISLEVQEKEENPITISGSCKILRKNYSTSRQGVGASLADTSKSMGHADTAVTVKNYTNSLAPEMREQERERLRKMDQYIVPLNY